MKHLILILHLLYDDEIVLFDNDQATIKIIIKEKINKINYNNNLLHLLSF